MTNYISLPIQADETRASWYRVVLVATMVAAAVGLLAATLITIDFLRDRAESPLAAANVVENSQALGKHAPALIVELKGLSVQLKTDPENEGLKAKIRNIDLALRQVHFQRRGRIVINAYILLASLGLVALGLKLSTQLAKNPPGMVSVFPPPQDFWKAASSARWPIVAVSGVLMGVLGVAAWEAPRVGPAFLKEVAKRTESVVLTRPTDAGAPLEEMLANWPSFRGAMGSGVSGDTAVPTVWDGAKGKNILWKTAVPLGGNNSPIVWGKQVFCAGGSADAQVVYCFDGESGALVWQAAVTGPVKGSAVKLNESTSFAPSTVATDGRRVYAIFPTMDVVGLDLAGKELWKKNLGKADNMYGHASSLAVCQGQLIIQFDQGEKAEAKKSCLLALDGATGGELWKTPRAAAQSWASPMVIYGESGAQIVTASKPLVAAYDAKDGHELYSAAVLDGDVAPSPAYANGKVFALTDQSPLVALSTASKGDVTKSPVWTAAGDPVSDDIPSPLATAEIVVVHSGMGHVAAYDPGTGKVLWEHDFDTCQASPICANKMVYMVDLKGVTHIFESATTFHELPACPLGGKEEVTATPAIANHRIYIRTKTNLYCIGTK